MSNRISLNQLETSERFFRIPKIFNDPDSPFFNMSTHAKYAYGLIRDRFELSFKNKWIDQDGAVYLVFTINSLSEYLGCGRDKAIAIKKELTECRLIEEDRAVGRANRIYLLNVEFSTTSRENRLP